MHLAATLRKPEGKTLEFKRDLSSPDRFLRAVVAFANTAGGTVLIGVEDGSGHVRGVTDPLALEERVASLISDSIRPRLLPDIEILSYRNKQLLAVRVYPSPARPHFIARAGLDAGVYVRVGSTNRRADAELVAEMQRFGRGESFDERPMPALDAEALDMQAAIELFAPTRKLTRKNLETLRLLVPYQGRLTPTAGGELLFGRDRLSHFPDAWLQVGRFDGTDKATILDHADIKTPLVQAIDEAIAFVEKHALRGAEINGLRRHDRWNAPPGRGSRSARQRRRPHGLFAAGRPDSHRDLRRPTGDREPGPAALRTHPGRSAARCVQVTQSRDRPRVARAGPRRAMGQRRAAPCSPPAGTPACRLRSGRRSAFGLRVTIRTRTTDEPEVDSTDRAILDLLKAGEGRSTREIAGTIGRSPRATRTRLAKLVSRGLVREVGTGPRIRGAAT